MNLRPIAALVVAAMVAGGCSAGQGAAPDRATVETPSAAPTAEASPPQEPPLEIESRETLRAALPAGTTQTRFVAAAGARDFGAFFEFAVVTGDPGTLDEAVFAVVDQELEAEHFGTFPLLAGQGTMVYPNPGGPLVTDDYRQRLGLSPLGPNPEGIFAVRLGPTHAAIGASRRMLANDLDAVLGRLGADGSGSLPEELPLATQLLADTDSTPTIERTEIQVAGESVVVDRVADDPDGVWFEFAALDATDGNGADAYVDIGTDLRLIEPSNFGIGGAPVEPAVLIWNDDQTTTLIRFSESLSVPEVVSLARTAAEGGLSGAAVVATPTPEVAPQVVGEPLSLETLAELQAYAEDFTGILAGAPLPMAFTDSIDDQIPDGFFVPAELWQVVRSLGLVAPDADRLEADRARKDWLKGTPTAMVPRSTEPFTRVVVVHEFAHLLTPERQTSPANPELVDPYTALLEGYAQWVARAYADQLTESEQQELPPYPGIFEAGPDPRLTPAMQDIIEFAYDEGGTFVEAIAAGDRADVARLFQSPPVSSEQILFPDAWRRGDAPERVDAPSPPDGEVVSGEGTIGAYVLFLVLRQHGVDPEAAREVIAAWAGDRYVRYSGADADCVMTDVRFDGESAAAAFEELLSGGSFTMSHAASTVSLTACV